MSSVAFCIISEQLCKIIHTCNPVMWPKVLSISPVLCLILWPSFLILLNTAKVFKQVSKKIKQNKPPCCSCQAFYLHKAISIMHDVCNQGGWLFGCLAFVVAALSLECEVPGFSLRASWFMYLQQWYSYPTELCVFYHNSCELSFSFFQVEYYVKVKISTSPKKFIIQRTWITYILNLQTSSQYKHTHTSPQKHENFITKNALVKWYESQC